MQSSQRTEQVIPKPDKSLEKGAFHQSYLDLKLACNFVVGTSVKSVFMAWRPSQGVDGGGQNIFFFLEI